MMDELDIIKSGIVNLKVKAVLITFWVKKFCVLYQATTDSHAFIEMYEDQKAFNEYKTRQKHNDIKKIELRNFTSVRHLTENTTKGSEYLIEIRCKKQKYVLMFNNEYESNEWESVLRNVLPCMADNEESSHSKDTESYAEDESDEVVTFNKTYGSAEKIQKFTVEVEPSDLAQRCDIVGKRIIVIKPCLLAFEDIETKQTMCSFDVSWIPKFGVKKSHFHFEVGKQCPDGKGTIVCNTDDAKLIHQVVQDMSKNAVSFKSQNSVKEVKASKKSAKSTVERDHHDLQPSLAVQPRNQETSSVGISEPLFVPSILRKHPSHTKTPMLIPIMLAHQDNNTNSITRKPSKDLNSKELDGQDVTKNGTQSVISKYAHDDFSKELEGIIQGIDANKKGTIKVHGTKKDRETDKNDKEGTYKKQDKEDKKEKEKREKEEKKERERLEKEKKQKEKEERKKLIQIKKETLKSTLESVPRAGFEAGAEVSQPSDTAYAECADVHNTVEPVADYARQGVKQNVDDGLYEEAMSVGKSKSPKQMFSEVVYAEPIGKKGGAHISGNPAIYTEVSIVNPSWKEHARKEEDEYHEEDYSNLQMAHRQMMDNPPIPQRQYNDEYNDNDDTYDRAVLKYPENKGKHINKQEVANENLYGMAGGKKIGLVLDFSTVPYSHNTADTGSGESIEEAENAYEDFDVSEKVKASSSRFPYVQSHEDTNVRVKPKPPPKPTSPTGKILVKNTLYEEVS